MKTFDKIAKNLGFTKPYKDVSLWYKNDKGSDNLIAVFDINKTCDMFIGNEDKLTIDFVKGSLNFFPKTIFSKHSINWVLPLLASDYFSHRQDFKNELIWAKKAMEQNKKLTPLQFSLQIRGRL